ncbi:4Fe-4S dicluster domain-containing protein [Siccirubricoccus sp. KC 17139]|uniref:4Fe-4S dicluster domain-containing protein n=1 Tax=Siccirubricoccus soli TaxID=2899147 RepID=A0ABT1D8C6_9PROT|nr:4Fe-4S dicluster domain-containing protein [Siccirubricoccus soli]MCO6417225.1 4Fe-4S dicluster domain-containing protein [Siccirubricoccus soli]MCP2683360.1 4Fe-4S dicluster domain-containing protein [Siccirubricoccus soli]
MTDRIAFVCSCEDSMPLDGRTLARGCAARGAELRIAEQLCRSQLDRFLAALGEGRPVTVGCTQEAPLFAQEAEAAGSAAPLTFVNLREQAGWSAEAAQTGPKMAALLAAAAVPLPATPLVPLKSEGVALVLGRDAVAIEAARRLADTLDLTVLLTGAEPVTPPRSAEFPVLRGRARGATGWLGTFEVLVDGYAAPSPASRDRYVWGAGKDGARSRCDLILDLTGGPPLLPATRIGYLRAAPEDAAAVERLIAEARTLVGEFDKPRFVQFEAGLCAHSRNRRTGCTRCLDLCPTGAITPGVAPPGARGAEHVALSAEICAGCGACAAVCPTGAITYALPPPATLLAQARALLLGFAEAGGRDPVLLLHGGEQGEALIDALARHGEGLPARVLPLRLNEPTQLDLALLAAAFAWGAASVRVLLPGHRPHGAEGLFRNLDYLGAALTGLGLEAAPPRAAAIETDDPFTLAEALSPALALRTPRPAASFLALGAPREVLRQALAALHGGAGPAVVQLPEQAPFGLALVAAEGCTLCLACTMVCPTQAFTANPDRPELSFLETACVQCGLCAATCPEKVITLEPRLNFAEAAARPVVVKAEAPALCTRCARPFGTASSLARVKAKLQASGHWMFQDLARLAVLEMCEDCRAIVAAEAALDPYAGPARPVTRTTEDWLRERDQEA